MTLGQYFVNPLYLAGAAMIAAPILIHLINRLRYKKVRWAAMEFLLDSQRRNRRRVLLEQLLLLAMRCLLIAGIVTVVARPIFGENLTALLASGQQTDHVVVLDDSYSMAQQSGSVAAFQEACRAIEELAAGLAARPGNHVFTLLRTSDPGNPDLRAVHVDQPFVGRLHSTLDSFKPTYLATAPARGVAAAAGLLQESDTASRMLHLVSDFRSKDWTERSETASLLRELEGEKVKLNLIDAAGPSGGNLGIEKITARLGSVAAGVPFSVEATVHNFSTEPATQVAVSPLVDKKPLPARTIESIAPGKSATVRFDVQLQSPGVAEVAVALPSDPLPADNRRSLAVNLRDRIPVLIVDGGTKRTDSQYLALALSPGGNARTGLDPIIRGVDVLKSGGLDTYPVIYLLNVASLDDEAAAALTRHVTNGGGLGIFLGDQVQPAAYNKMLDANKQTWLPIHLGSVRDTPPASAAGPDLALEKHPVFRVFEGERNPFVEAVRVSKLFTVTDEKLPETIKVIARYRDGSPLALETRVGAGRVVAFLTTAGPEWNTWARNPSYVVAMLELEAHLAEPPGGEPDYRVGEPWQARFDAGEFRREVVFSVPAEGAAVEASPAQETVEAELRGLVCELAYANTQLPGTYQLTKTTINGERQTVARAYNVDPAEGDLAKITAAELAERLAGIAYQFHSASDFEPVTDESRFEPRDWLLLLFVGLLVAEQLLAYRLSYHWK